MAYSGDTHTRQRFRLGLLINPYAGVGGPTAQKGSDSAAVQSAASQGQLTLTAPKRAANFLSALAAQGQNFELITVAGAMGEEVCQALGLRYALAAYTPAAPSSFRDTEHAAVQLAASGIDLLAFVGGDGTARDLCRVLGDSQLALGVPAGVKMHSGVYAVNPQAAAEVVKQMITGELVNVDEREVRDIDEEAFRKGVVKSRFFGVMQVPDEVRYVQQVKQGGQEIEELVLADIAADIAEALEEDTLYIFGPGSTTHTVLENLQWPSTLLGVDVFRQEQVLKNDASADDIQAILTEHHGPVALYITAIGGQGHILGRGNQQLSPAVLRRIGRGNVHVLATKTKLKNLSGRPLLIDTGDAELDEEWQGFIKVITGYHDTVLYRLGFAS